MKWWKRASSPDEKETLSAPVENEASQQNGKKDAVLIRRHFIVSGRVQGVGFRYTAYQVANSYGMTGWVRNCYDGTVEMEVQGPEGLVNTFLKRMQLTNKWMRIERTKENDIPVINETGFHERY